VRIRFLLFNLLIIVCLGFGAPAPAKTCQECHLANKMLPPHSSHLHPPYIEGKCSVCHEGSFSTTDLNASLQGVKWFLKQHFRGGRAYIVLSPKFKAYDLVFQSMSPPFHKILSFASAKSLVKGPEAKIERVWFCGVQEEPWVEAEICVKTNVPTQVFISCGGVSGGTDENYYTFQVIPLAHVVKGKTYTCTVEAKDFDGLPAPPLSFSFQISEPRTVPVMPPAQDIEVHLYRSSLDEPVLEIYSDGSFDWRLGGVPVSISSNKTKEIPKDHPYMKPLNWSGIDACYQCHKKSMLGVSHPVGVPLKPNMALKNDLPLAAGVMTCATCHNPHGSPYPYRLRKYGEALCLSCHSQK